MSIFTAQVVCGKHGLGWGSSLWRSILTSRWLLRGTRKGGGWDSKRMIQSISYDDRFEWSLTHLSLGMSRIRNRIRIDKPWWKRIKINWKKNWNDSTWRNEQNSLESTTTTDIPKATDRSRREMQEEHELEIRKKDLSSLRSLSDVDRCESVRGGPKRWRTLHGDIGQPMIDASTKFLFHSSARRRMKSIERCINPFDLIEGGGHRGSSSVAHSSVDREMKRKRLTLDIRELLFGRKWIV